MNEVEKMRAKKEKRIRIVAGVLLAAMLFTTIGAALMGA